MSYFKILLVLAICFITHYNYAQHTDEINSNRPGRSMSAYAVGKSVIQLETGIYGINENHSLLGYDANGFGFDMDLRYGFLLERLEVMANLQYQKEEFVYTFDQFNKSALKQSLLGAKYLIYDPYKNYEKKVNIYSWKANHAFNWHQLIPAVSFYAGANFTTKNNPYSFSAQAKISPKAMLITQNHLGDGSWVFVTNIIADNLLTDFPSYGYIITLTKGINQKWSGFIENQGFKSDFYSDSILRGGAAFLINKNTQIDASISHNLFKDTPSIFYGGVGFSWRYDAGYKEVRLDLDDSPSQPKSVRKAAKKDQKRRDAIE